MIQAISRAELKPFEAMAYPLQLSALKSIAPLETKKFLIVLLVRLVSFSHTKERMSSEEIEVLSRDILQDYWFLKPTEVYLIFEALRKSKNFNRLDSSVVHDFFKNYVDNEREKALMLFNANAKKESQELIDKEIQEVKDFYEVMKQRAENNEVHKALPQRIDALRAKLKWSDPDFMQWRSKVLSESQAKKELAQKELLKQQLEELEKLKKNL